MYIGTVLFVKERQLSNEQYYLRYCIFPYLNWNSVLYLAGKRTKRFLSELLIRQVMTTCKTTEGSKRQPGKPGICELTEFMTNSKKLSLDFCPQKRYY